MSVARALLVLLIATVLTCGVSLAVTHRIDGTLPGGGDCPTFGNWDPETSTCRIDDGLVQEQEWLTIEFATVDVVGTLTNRGLIDNRGKLIITGFLNSTNDLVNNWDGTLINRGEFFSHFMYNFGPLTNQPGGTIEFELHLENNALMTNHGHIIIGGNYFVIPERTLENLGSIDIEPAGVLTNAGRLIHAGQIDNAGLLQNTFEMISHCDSSLAGNPIVGIAPTGAQSMTVGPDALHWCAIDLAAGHDIVEGDLNRLRSSGGDFSSTTTACTGNDVSQLTLDHFAEPASGDGVWFLVRANGVASADFDTVFSSQVGSRAAEIAASPEACP